VSSQVVTYADMCIYARQRGSNSLARPVMRDLTCSVSKNRLWMLTRSDLTLVHRGEWRVRSLGEAARPRVSKRGTSTSDPISSVSGHYLTMRGWLVTIGISRSRLNHGDTWTAVHDRTLGCLSLVGWTCTSSHLEKRC
jgi:hypothetical protein